MKPIGIALSTCLLTGLLTLLSGCAALVDSVNEEPVNIDNSKRTWGSWIDDQTIETVTAVNINKADPALRESRVKVISFNGTVLLIGQVPNANLKKLAGQTAQRVEKVRQVYNELEIGPNADILVQSNDSWLTTKIKTSMVTNEAVIADRIKINTEQGTVYLMGLITPKMAQEAVSIAANTYGVSRVVKVFEYVR
ncbi:MULTISPECIES: BON domain-containing protein [Gammaproteobacteria]|uniref:BON domain-containing protein n=1 Tax=Gammaproteobacteria TaxID=1236 RepID=UPI001ADAADE8|nr:MULTISPECIES: BON domain-containing protein [Gammaproteobacteria]MBO9481217.1 BON domain-containing protein [Salinisphaera sp. G21_0]MBO9494870.1 BON domain-containing protein [Thalassotalea sp. G20_0]